MQTDLQLRWHRACGSSACVEVATTPSAAYVRDSEAPQGDRLAVSAPAWSAFITAVAEDGIPTDRH
ncbi:DUF397 domain-containing protein [Catenuloplanes atrovinosus]|uniref:DUF397 domain-containing protein n=1 Tax=Catenuloplanes atrovinosus TaxID=137266 RepID=A0AAE4CB94_9ACTN|nr:DUF397 domain-containing protein [Catenuloplanes atrovinosus]MDR7278441.1 hypothetical protein [Catenuloplanes atrovinosus]